MGEMLSISSEQIIAETLQCLSQELIISDLQSNNFFSLMTDESTDIAVLKQLVLVGTDEGVKTSFLCITDMHS